MTYRIVFMERERVIVNTPWDRSLESAKQHALDGLKIHSADRVEIRRDDDDQLVFQHPRVLRAKGT